MSLSINRYIGLITTGGEVSTDCRVVGLKPDTITAVVILLVVDLALLKEQSMLNLSVRVPLESETVAITINTIEAVFVGVRIVPECVALTREEGH